MHQVMKIGGLCLVAVCLGLMAKIEPSTAAPRFAPPSPTPHPFTQTVSSANPAVLPTDPGTRPLLTGSLGASASQGIQSLRPIVDALAEERGRAAYAGAQSLREPALRDLGLWLVARTRADDLSVELRATLRDAFAGWPGAAIVARQTDRAITERFGSQVPDVALFGSIEARTSEARLLQAQALMRAGQTERARTIAVDLWRTDVLDDGLEGRLRQSLGQLLRQEDHRHRAHWLLYRDRITGAERLQDYLTQADRSAIAARAVAIRQRTEGLASLEQAVRNNPGNVHLSYELARLYRRADRPRDAARVLNTVRASGPVLVRPDVWWRERRIVARDLLEAGDPSSAYGLVASPPGSGAADDAESAFLAGWIALRFMADAPRAEQHFRTILTIGTTPITRARGFYWLGRALAERGDTQSANQAFAEAATYGETFYGQAAANTAGVGVRFARLPRPQAPSHVYFRYAELLYGLERRVDARLFLYALARDSAPAGAIVAMANLASRFGDATAVVQLGKIGALRHRSLATLGYPVGAFPHDARIPERLPAAVAYAISRQESGFDARARSRAGALGLMQLMPATARRVARDMGIAHSTSRLTSDPAHNVTLGAFHLDELIADYNGSYILTFIAYNAGPGRVPQWIERFGDPRSGQVDIIDWIELIPFSETRSYVQRVLENIFVYEHLLTNG